jgi:hypothetical protein
MEKHINNYILRLDTFCLDEDKNSDLLWLRCQMKVKLEAAKIYIRSKIK